MRLHDINMRIRHCWLCVSLALAVSAQTPTYYGFSVDQDRLQGVVDFSWLNRPLTANDGLRVRRGHFYTAGRDHVAGNSDDERVRLFGVNFTFGANFPDNTNGDARRIAKRLRRLGINLVRLHHMDSQQDAPSNASAASGLLTTDAYPSFNAVSLARLRAFMDALRAEGIYVDLNLHVGYVFRPTVDNVPALAGGMPEQSKPLHIFYPRMVALQQQFAQQLIEKLKLRDDPVLAVVEISNESSLVQAWQWSQLDPYLVGDYKTALEAQWNAWLKAKYGTTQALASAWGSTQPNGPNLLTGNWQLEAHAPASGTLTLDAGGGAHVANIVGGGWLFLKQTGFHLSAGNRYLWSFEARADVAASASANVTIMRDVSPWDGYLYSSIAVTNQWQSYTMAANASVDVNDSGRVSVDVQTIPGPFYVRNMTLVAVGRHGLDANESLEAGTVQRPGSNDGPSSMRLQDYVAFLTATDRAYMTAMRDTVRAALGPDVAITGTQIGYGGLSVMDSQSELDYQDNHFYIDHPNFPNIAWDSWDWRIHDQAAGDDTWSALIDMAWARQAGRPYTVSEFNQPWPNRHGMEVDPATAAFGALQDWDSIMHFDYLGSRDWDHTAPGGFDLNADWTKMPLIAQSAWLFRTGAVETGRAPITLQASAAARAQSAVGAQSVTTWVASTLGVPKEAALTRRVEIDALDATAGNAAPPSSDALKKLTSPYVSDTGELSFDASAKLLTINAPTVAGFVGAIGAGVKRTAGAVDVELPSGARGFGSWLLTAIDERPLAQSTSLLLTLPGYALRSIPAAGERAPDAASAKVQELTNYLGDTLWWTIDATNASPAWGTWRGKTPPSGNFGTGFAPTYMERVEGWLTLRTAAKSLTVYVLDGAGKSVGALPEAEVQPVSGGFRIHLNGDAQAARLRLSPWYWISSGVPQCGSRAVRCLK